MKIILLASSIILTLISCNNSNQSKELPIQWETLIIESSNQIITIKTICISIILSIELST